MSKSVSAYAYNSLVLVDNTGMLISANAYVNNHLFVPTGMLTSANAYARSPNVPVATTGKLNGVEAVKKELL